MSPTRRTTGTATRPAAPPAPRADGVPGHTPPPPSRDRALLGVHRAAVEVAAARRRLELARDVATAAGATTEELDASAAAAHAELPPWMPRGGGPPSHG